MRIATASVATASMLAIFGLAGCRVHTDKNGDHKDVNIATPFGGMQVKTDDKVVPAEVGLPVYPGASLLRKEGKNTGSADVNMSFGSFQLRVRAVSYRTPDAPEKVETFYRDKLQQYGDVIACRGGHTVGTPAHTSQGLTCADDHHGKHLEIDTDSDPHSQELKLKAGSAQHQHVVGIDPEDGGTKIGLVALDLPGKLVGDDGGERDRQ